MNLHLSTFISRLPGNSLVIVPGNSEVIRNGDVYFPFRQSSDFLYLTSMQSPDIILTIYWSEYILWRNPISEKEILWWHSKLTDLQMIAISGISDIRDKNEFEKYLAQNKSVVLEESEWKKILHNQRLIKTPDEIEKIKCAIRISHTAFAHVEKIIQPGMFEYEIEAEFARIFRCHHLSEAYPTIVASWSNACILHYTDHTRCIVDGDFVLIDAGCEYMGYASDTTRTFLVGDWTERKKQIYDAVCRIKIFAEKSLRPGIFFSEYERAVRNAMNQELTLLGLISDGKTEDEIEILSRKYYPHRTSHFLGLDVHDVGPRDILLAPGMVLTIEPGIYIKQENIGIRIEDDYLITDSGCEILL
jgi:Xaa-Pro aminopeptidase